MNNITLPKSLILSLAGLLLVTFSAAAGTSVEGIVKDPAGRPVKGADVRIEAKKFSKMVNSDARGHYVFDGLKAGTYKVTLLVDGQVKASIMDAKTQAGKATQLNFNLTGQMASANKKTHWVYVHPDIGTHIGGSRWVEVDENGNIVGGNTGASSNVQTITGTAVQQTVIRPPVQNPGK